MLSCLIIHFVKLLKKKETSFNYPPTLFSDILFLFFEVRIDDVSIDEVNEIYKSFYSSLDWSFSLSYLRIVGVIGSLVASV